MTYIFKILLKVQVNDFYEKSSLDIGQTNMAVENQSNMVFSISL